MKVAKDCTEKKRKKNTPANTFSRITEHNTKMPISTGMKNTVTMKDAKHVIWISSLLGYSLDSQKKTSRVRIQVSVYS